MVTAAMKVHSVLGPGWLESAYQAVFSRTPKPELKVLSQVDLPLIYDGEKLDLGYRVDLLVEHQAVVEISVSRPYLCSSRTAAFLHAAQRQEPRSSH